MSLLLVATPTANAPQPRNPRFVIAGWDHPDQYGQGIYAITVSQNISGSWIGIANLYSYNSTIVEINATENIQIQFRGWLNNSVVGATSLEDGKNYVRHSADIYEGTGHLLFSRQGGVCTYSHIYSDPNMFQYYYDLTLDLSPQAGHTYTVDLNYEVLYGDDIQTITPIVTADSDDTNWEDSTNENGRTEDYVAGYIAQREYWFRVQIPIPQNATVLFATAYFYATIIDTGTEAITLQRSTEIGLGSMEADGTKPATTATNASSGNWPSGTGWFTVNCTETIHTLINNGSWVNNSYAGFRLYDSGGSDDGNALEDYQHADSHHTYLYITYGINVEWKVVSYIETFFFIDPSEVQVWLGNFALVILGVIMVPVSTLYLAYGVKHDRTSDRMFYGLLMFMVGCGLLVAGITP